ncbi:unnamed protein product [Schistosoma rodhaini]|uniref:Uncharacterized protein n=1 Tax=Schistosoma rodhaini TaxID=6188 RepID=A0AA85G2L0_9TREM|nr:unnamed protein product [Schistosoma rodhaini]
MLMTDTFSAAHDNLIKNHGTPGLWFAHTADYCETPPKPRVRLNAIEIADRNKKHLTTAEISGFVNDFSNAGTNFSTDETNIKQKPQLRLRTPEAYGIAQKSKSESDKWCDFAENLNYQPVVRPPRIGPGELAKGLDDLLTMKMSPNELYSSVPYGCPTKEAQNNAQWSRTGTEMALCLGKNVKQTDIDNHLSLVTRPHSAAVRGYDAEQWRLLGRNGHISNSMSLEAEEDPSNIVHHRVRPDGETILEKSVSGSQVIGCLNMCNNDKDDSNTAFSGYRLRTEEALEAMKRNQGKMSDYLGSNASSVTKHYGRKFQIRAVRGSEAHEAALNNKGSAMKELITNDRLPPSPIGCGFAHVSQEAQETANLSRTGMISGLLGGPSMSNIPLVGVEAPPQRHVQYEAIEYANRDQGQEMKSILTQNWK